MSDKEKTTEKQKHYKLNFEMVPDGCWHSNLRTVLSPAAWNAVRKAVYARAGGRCEICGRSGVRLEAHEQWEYDEERGIQKLVGLVALCGNCHTTVHIGRAQLTGHGEQAEDWFMKVNGCTYAEMRAALGKANEEHAKRNKIPEWMLDISILREFCKIKDK